MKELFERIKKCTKSDPAQSDAEFLLYLIEEVGEVSTCISVNEKLKKRKLEEELDSELADVIITALGMFAYCNGDFKDLKFLINKKLSKWERRTGNS